MSKDIRVISGECCDIWNNLKDKTQMIDYLIESKKQVADLEAKLAESNENIKLLEQDRVVICNTMDMYIEKVEKLKQQLVEKDEEIEKLQHCNDRLAQGIYHSYGEHFISKVKQDKISFAVEQLEKVKEKILSYEEIYYQFSENGAKIPVFCVENFRVRQNIDNKITELTHQHEDKGE